MRHSIDVGDHPPIRQKAYRIPESQKSNIRELITSMLTQGVITPSNSPWASPIVIAKKKDGTDRFCIDFRKLNHITRKGAFPLPNIMEILDQLGQAQLFSSLDLASGYWQIRMSDRDREKTAFTTFMGLFEWTIMPFGLTNAPATFQRAMQFVLAGLQNKNCLVYIDDILIFSPTFEQHLNDIAEVLTKLKEHNLKLKPKKCSFGRKQLAYLGHLISKEGVRPDPAKIEAVQKLSAPDNLESLQTFLGLASYYRKFVPDFASIAEPLNKLLRKGFRYCWSPLCQEAFQKLKLLLTESPVLAFPDFSRPFIVTADASGVGLGAVLSQSYEKGERPVAYDSRTLSPAEHRYSVIEQEALAVVWAVKQWRPYLFGRRFTIITDHAPLSWLMSTTHSTGRLQRWALVLQE